MSFRSYSNRQTTLERDIVLKGAGVHSGAEVSLILHPAEANSGYNFYVSGGKNAGHVPGDFRAVTNLTLCTVISGAGGASVATVEHLLSALRGMGIDNADIEVDGNELPILDGSAEPFVAAIEEAGVRELDEARRYIKILRPVAVTDGGSIGEIFPYDGFRLDIEIDFPTPLIGRQRIDLDVTPASFKKHLSRARTFGFMKDVKQLWAAGRALGSSLENTVAIGEDRILNPEGLRYPDEFVRHKTLDAVGDFALAGAAILGLYRSKRPSHKLNSMMLHALYENRDAWTVVEAADKTRRHYVSPRADFGIAFATPNFAPENA
ncbi:UDP-3-O-acyl-N-acetylglucosamine deacetylase [Rhodomicrobium vannielii ATCC 17100]|uniref:UDP-3-O-acyl-N-acetylglucosamine deacetylase n=1 Tax=Rhodomicrobium vannielii TaxID=1069 RepID=UPI001917C19E|nr:UDP-3-O-acyl-N-acetylglucosamine deacetylase [Rhodomicrobium vannielii]MBJ7535736.1 UDP-3-O-acyl-N-acetylglucosamine deacetylase [Rhodomicrobium vannielii ATCC 17100]